MNVLGKVRTLAPITYRRYQLTQSRVSLVSPCETEVSTDCDATTSKQRYVERLGKVDIMWTVNWYRVYQIDLPYE